MLRRRHHRRCFSLGTFAAALVPGSPACLRPVAAAIWRTCCRQPTAALIAAYALRPGLAVGNCGHAIEQGVVRLHLRQFIGVPAEWPDACSPRCIFGRGGILWVVSVSTLRSAQAAAWQDARRTADAEWASNGLIGDDGLAGPCRDLERLEGGRETSSAPC